jgi:hypothetical protein
MLELPARMETIERRPRRITRRQQIEALRLQKATGVKP